MYDGMYPSLYHTVYSLPQKSSLQCLVIPCHKYPTLAITDVFIVSIALAFTECHTFGIIQYVAFSDWLIISPGNMHLNFLHVFSWFDSLFLFTRNNIPIVSNFIYLFTY